MERGKKKRGTVKPTDHHNSVQCRHAQGKRGSVQVRDKVAAVLEWQLVSAIHWQQFFIYGWREKAYAEIKCKAYGYLGNESNMEGGLSQGRHSLWT